MKLSTFRRTAMGLLTSGALSAAGAATFAWSSKLDALSMDPHSTKFLSTIAINKTGFRQTRNLPARNNSFA